MILSALQCKRFTVMLALLDKLTSSGEEMICSMRKDIAEYRSSVDFRAGSRSCFYNLDIKRRYDVGVNKFESLVAEMGMTLPVVKVRVITTKSSATLPVVKVRVITTKSSALSWGYSNLISGLTITEVNRVMVGDITYLYHNGVRYYFFQYLDVFSGRVVGWSIAENMKTERAIVDPSHRRRRTVFFSPFYSRGRKAGNRNEQSQKLFGEWPCRTV